ncbi:hypothetical protein Astex_3669 (plasmid) [Asticcacaulis excentricus CB 48]|uniref:Uncharacterized protein n=1 Tax=Asticcacaulis excentricus (strain ATCC 15261 / DSM 4724 / KCTC 12464 / NCIMB 9791 / VKM B-1370 / CB 48) TaxID=573065 RepID=E8RVF0_ASTEC|nr:hypothetical protein Astex_3669 [Asticcacaulis excentricus CB 48]
MCARTISRFRMQPGRLSMLRRRYRHTTQASKPKAVLIYAWNAMNEASKTSSTGKNYA